MITNRKFKIFCSLSIILLGFTACSSGNDLITTEKQVVQMTTAMKSYMSKKIYTDMSKEELCVVMSESVSEGLNSAGSSFKAMNTWIREYKDPRLALAEQTYTSQVAGLIIGMANKTCEPKELTKEAGQFVAYVRENIKAQEKEDKNRKAAKIERLGGSELKEIIAEMKSFEYQCISNISTDYDWILENINESTLNKYRKNLAASRKCQEEVLIKQKEREAREKSKLAEMNAYNEEIRLKRKEKQVRAKAKAEKGKADKKTKIATALKNLNEARKKIQILNQQCVKSNFMLNMFQTSEYEHTKKSITWGNTGAVSSYIRAVNQHIAASKCKPS